jgi:hypothetical protein
VLLVAARTTAENFMMAVVCLLVWRRGELTRRKAAVKLGRSRVRGKWMREKQDRNDGWGRREEDRPF